MNKTTFFILFTIMINFISSTKSTEEQNPIITQNKSSTPEYVIKKVTSESVENIIPSTSTNKVEIVQSKEEEIDESNEDLENLKKTLSQKELNKNTPILSGKIDSKTSSEESNDQESLKEIQNGGLILPTQSESNEELIETSKISIDENNTPMQDAVNNKLVDMVEEKKKGLNLGVQSLPNKALSRLSFDDDVVKKNNSAPEIKHQSKLIPDDEDEFVKIVGFSALVMTIMF